MVLCTSYWEPDISARKTDWIVRIRWSSAVLRLEGTNEDQRAQDAQTRPSQWRSVIQLVRSHRSIVEPLYGFHDALSTLPLVTIERVTQIEGEHQRHVSQFS